MNREEIIILINKIQNTNNVNEFVYEGYDLWPFIKTTLINKILATQLKGLAKVKKTYLSILFLVLKSPFLVIYYKFFKSKIKYLFIGSKADNEIINGKLVNKHFHLLIKQKIKSLLITTDFTSSKVKNSELYFSFWFFFSIPFFISSKLFKHKYRTKKKVINSIMDDLKKILHPFDEINNFSIDAFLKKTAINIYRIPIYDTTSKFILKTTKAESISIVCYYNLVAYAFIKNAHSMNIPSIDMQHGTQGELHAAYCDFSNYKSNFSNIIPNYFWCWDESSAAVINNWSKKCNSHKAYNFGNPWHSNFITSKNNLNNEILILITLQFNYIEQRLIDVIKESPTHYKWLIRFHPMRKNSKKIITNQIKANKIEDKIEMKMANTLPLPKILSFVNVHISKYSGAILEASIFGVYSIITDPVGEKSFKNLIESNRAFIAYDSKKISNIIKKILTLKKLDSRINSIKNIKKNYMYLTENKSTL